MPTDLGIGSKKGEGLMGREKKAVTKIGTRLRREVVGLVVEVLVGLGADEVDRAHREPDFLKRSSRRRCFSCQ